MFLSSSLNNFRPGRRVCFMINSTTDVQYLMNRGWCYSLLRETVYQILAIAVSNNKFFWNIFLIWILQYLKMPWCSQRLSLDMTVEAVSFKWILSLGMNPLEDIIRGELSGRSLCHKFQHPSSNLYFSNFWFRGTRVYARTLEWNV